MTVGQLKVYLSKIPDDFDVVKETYSCGTVSSDPIKKADLRFDISKRQLVVDATEN